MLSLAAAASAQQRPQPTPDDRVYTWTDANGVRHYGDGSTTPPAEFARSKARDIRLSLPAELRHGQPPSPQADPATPASSDKMTAQWEDGANPGEKLAPTRAAACEVAQRNVDVLSDQSQPAYVRDDKGNPVALDAAGRQARLAEAQGNVSSYCTQ
jgi:hypothetical protein